MPLAERAGDDDDVPVGGGAEPGEDGSPRVASPDGEGEGGSPVAPLLEEGAPAREPVDADVFDEEEGVAGVESDGRVLSDACSSSSTTWYFLALACCSESADG